MEPVKIIDIIDHRNKYGIQQFLVVNRNPQYLYERKGMWLIAEDSGFFSFYKYERPGPTWKAFAGRKFDIAMKTGPAIKAYGQWWDGTPRDYNGLIRHIGFGTPDGLAECNVFCSARVDPVLIDAWLSKNEPSNNYHKYDKRHADYGKQTIESRWDSNPRSLTTISNS